MWCLPYKVDARFVTQMELILRTYHSPYDPEYPVVCFDEKGKELLLNIVPEIPMKPGQSRKIDYEYKHNGACNLFVAYEPHTGWRKVAVTRRRRAVECAQFLKELVMVKYASAKKVILVCDNLNIHDLSCLYVAFEPEEAIEIASRIEFRHTPKHASWLNMAEIEIGVLSRQCLRRRMGEIEFVASEVGAWEERRNRQATKIKWLFDCVDARQILKRLYPLIQKLDEEESDQTSDSDLEWGVAD